VKIISAETAEIGKLYYPEEQQVGVYYSRTSSGHEIAGKDILIEKKEPIFLIGRENIKKGMIHEPFILAHVLIKKGIFYLNFTYMGLEEI
jgi:hypothetical protein